MSDDAIQSNEREDPSGLSRRAALKAGVGVGVGIAAWSGPTITSLGGTPAYAAGCTFVVQIDLSGGCRNTDQGNCPSPTPSDRFGYHTLKDTGLPTGFSLTNNVPEGTCCDALHTPVLNFPTGLTCGAKISFNSPPQCTGADVGTIVIPPVDAGPGGGSLPIELSCIEINPNTQYTIVASCTTTGADPDCFI